MTEQQSGPLVRDPHVRQAFGGISKSTRRRYERLNIIPKPFQLTPGGPDYWFLGDVEAAVAALAAEGGGVTRTVRKRLEDGTFAPSEGASAVADESGEAKPVPRPKRPVLIRKQQLEEV